MIEITSEYMSLVVDDKLVANARFSWYTAGDGNGAWIVSLLPAQRFTRDQATTGSG